MALEPDKLQQIIFKATMAYFDQMQRDIETRIALLLKLEDTGLGTPVLQMIAVESAEKLTNMMRELALNSGEIDRTIRKLL